MSLIDALAAVFPAVQRITGVEFFRAMARSYMRETPPRSPLLFEYGHDFPLFVERYEYASQMPWLGDVARLERAGLTPITRRMRIRFPRRSCGCAQ